MARTITIFAGAIEATADLNDGATATAIWQALPIEATASTWGDEIYFAIPVAREVENGQATVSLGDLGYWPPGQAFCIFFGPTPASRTSGEIRPASPVTVVGRLRGDPTVFKRIRAGERVRLVPAGGEG